MGHIEREGRFGGLAMFHKKGGPISLTTSDDAEALFFALTRKFGTETKNYARCCIFMATKTKLPSLATPRVIKDRPSARNKKKPDNTLSPKPLFDRILARAARIPAEDLAAVPRDLARNLHHYAYGAPKEES